MNEDHLWNIKPKVIETPEHFALHYIVLLFTIIPPIGEAAHFYISASLSIDMVLLQE